jgi:hypothetical protein
VLFLIIFKRMILHFKYSLCWSIEVLFAGYWVFLSAKDESVSIWSFRLWIFSFFRQNKNVLQVIITLPLMLFYVFKIIQIWRICSMMNGLGILNMQKKQLWVFQFIIIIFYFCFFSEAHLMCLCITEHFNFRSKLMMLA